MSKSYRRPESLAGQLSPTARLVTRCAAALLFGLLGLLAEPLYAAAPQQIPEPGSGQQFQTPLDYGKKPYLLVGTGLRKDAAVKHYAMALYVEENAKQSFFGVYDRAGRHKAGLFFESRAQNFYSWGHFAKLAVLRFLKPTPKDEVQKIFRDGLAELLTPQSPPDVHKDVQSFLDLLDSDLKEGQELRLHCDDIGHLEVSLDAAKKIGPQDARLCRHIWDIWLGSRAVQKEMRNSLLDRLESLAK